jgi:hypothetical protein
MPAEQHDVATDGAERPQRGGPRTGSCTIRFADLPTPSVSLRATVQIRIARIKRSAHAAYVGGSETLEQEIKPLKH